MEDQILEKILITTYTMSSLKKRVKALKSRLSEHFFGNDTNKDMVIEELDWLNTYGVQFLNMFEKENFYQNFVKIEERVNAIHPLTVYIAFEVGDEEIKQIGSRVRDMYSNNLVLDLKYDPTLIGGCAFIWNGVYKDYSIKSKIVADKTKILGSFKSFLAAKK